MWEWISQPWPWYVSGPMIVVVLGLLLVSGKSFGVSSSLSVVCAACGGGRRYGFFDFDWRRERWKLMFLLGATGGGAIAALWLNANHTPDIAPATEAMLAEWNVPVAEGEVVPTALFSWDQLGSYTGWIVMVLGGFLVGFGARYAGGCTSGHAITGLSSLQRASLIAVIGFFIGGLLVSWLVLPHLF